MLGRVDRAGTGSKRVRCDGWRRPPAHRHAPQSKTASRGTVDDRPAITSAQLTLEATNTHPKPAIR